MTQVRAPGVDVPQNGVEEFFGLGGVQGSELFKEGTRLSAVRFITSTNPKTGNVEFWEHAGRPVLFTRDLRTCRRVQKIARRARRTMPTAAIARRRTRRRATASASAR